MIISDLSITFGNDNPDVLKMSCLFLIGETTTLNTRTIILEDHVIVVGNVSNDVNKIKVFVLKKEVVTVMMFLMDFWVSKT